MLKFNEVYFLTKYLNILYVEDDEDIRESVCDILEDFFNIVNTAKNGQEGLEKYKNYHIKNNKYHDIIITDLNMPKMDGITMIEEIAQINPSQKIIVISAHDDSEKLIKLIDLGISAFILKPIENQKLINAIYKVSKEAFDEINKRNYLIKQSKMAQMGIMIDMIAHQWLQPVQVMKMQNDLLTVLKESNKLSVEQIDEYLKIQINQTELLAETLKEFRNFFKEDKEKTETDYYETVEKVLVLIKSRIKNKVKIIKEIKHRNKIKVYINEFKHVIINIIINATEALENKNIKNGIIKLETSITDKSVNLHISDNAGGIKKTLLKKIFAPYFTTKKSGTGIGLYLSKLIVEKSGGNLTVENITNGAKFTISLPISNS